jgi:hypothetical protein
MVSVDVKEMKDKVETFRANAPKDLTREQVSSIVKAYVNSQAEGGSAQSIDLSTDRLSSVGGGIVPRLKEAIKEYSRVEADEDRRSMTGGVPPELQFKYQQWLTDFLSHNRKLFVDANYLRDIILIRLGRDVPEQRWFDVSHLSSGEEMRLQMQTGSLEDLIRDLQTKLPQ